MFDDHVRAICRTQPWSPSVIGLRDLKGLLELCQQKLIGRGYVVTKSLDDFGVIKALPDTDTRIMRIPAPLLCYWMGASELGLGNE